MRSELDPRPTIGVFLASEQEFFTERSHLAPAGDSCEDRAWAIHTPVAGRLVTLAPYLRRLLSNSK